LNLALGTVQFGLSYGISNQEGRTPENEVYRILTAARDDGATMLDTAHAYGAAEEIIGQLVGEDPAFQIVTKIGARIDESSAAAAHWSRELEESLRRLRRDSVYGILIHNVANLNLANGRSLWRLLERARKDGVVKKIGISVYAPADLDALYETLKPELVQMPLSLFDQRFLESGWIVRLQQNGVEIHVRSVFLQGLLLMPEDQRPAWVSSWSDQFQTLAKFLERYQLSPLEACLGFVRSVEAIDYVVIGMNSLSHYGEIQSAIGRECSFPGFQGLSTKDEALINPARWPT
jgi:aryl-alcohol dehydrogenase-like predicted oxidoreductase